MTSFLAARLGFLPIRELSCSSRDENSRRAADGLRAQIVDSVLKGNLRDVYCLIATDISRSSSAQRKLRQTAPSSSPQTARWNVRFASSQDRNSARISREITERSLLISTFLRCSETNIFAALMSHFPKYIFCPWCLCVRFLQQRLQNEESGPLGLGLWRGPPCNLPPSGRVDRVTKGQVCSKVTEREKLKGMNKTAYFCLFYSLFPLPQFLSSLSLSFFSLNRLLPVYTYA